MKTKIIYTIVLLFLTVAFISKIPEAEEKSVFHTHLQPGSAIPDNGFMLCAVHNAHDQENNYANMKGYFHLNTWHKYTGPYWGWYLPGTDDIDTNDKIDGDTSVYGPHVRQSISNNNTAELRTIMDRPIIEYLAFGQRSDYQCESLHVDADYQFYTYYHSKNNGTTIKDEEDNSQFGNGQMVKYCTPSLTDAGYIIDSLRANREQANKHWNPWNNDDTYKWYIKPRIRVDPSFVQNTPNDTICRIEIINWDGDTVKQVGLLGKYFKDQYGNYDGRYLMEYNFDSPSDTELIVNPGWLICPGDAKDFWDWDNETIKTDFRVYWYGTCEMWIDYVRVENLPSVQLHSGEYDGRIAGEVDWALTGYDLNRPNNFYVEEFEFNIRSSIKRVDSIIRSHSGNKLALMVNLNYGLFKVHIPDAWNVPFDSDDVKKYLIDYTGLKYLVLGCYPLEGWERGGGPNNPISLHPNTLSTEEYSKSEGILSYDTIPDAYDSWLQERFDEGEGERIYTYIMKLSDGLTKLTGSDLRLINLHQAHLWWASGHKLKEPTNEEAELMSDLAISYGAKGIMYFCYTSHNTFDDSEYSRGLTEPNYDLRDTSVYGQNKAQKYREMNQKYTKWAPYIMSFDDANRESYIYRDGDERNALIQTTYFLSARTFKPGSGTPICSPADSLGINPYPEQSLTYDCPEHTYLQVALFDDDIVDYDKYFMIVNRRCSPFIDPTPGDNNGGRRFVRVLFNANHSAFPNYNNWNIMNVESDSVYLTFDKRVTSYLDLGWYMPGEGRLYKITPVIPTGGTLVSNEVVDENVNCSGMIYNNGYDITINSNKTLSFSEGAGIEMTGGSFFCGSDAGEEINITFKGLNGNRWNGITLDECDTIGIYCAKFEDVKQDKTGGGNNFALNLIDCYNFKIAKNLFECKQDSAFGGINSVYISEYNDTIISYISENTFDMNNSPSPSVEIISSAGITTPLLLQWNEFSTTCDSSIAIIINSVVGGAIKNNTIEGYKKGINSLSSSIDIYENTIITSSFNDAVGILAVSGSTLNMGPNSAYLLGGYNIFSNTGTGTRNIEVVNSYFDVYEGENSFNISDNDPQTAYHFYGYFPEELEEGDEEATINCFLLDSTENEANHDVTWGEEGDNVNFIFDDNCGGQGGGQSGGLSSSGSNDYVVFYIGNGITDTVYLRTSGNGTLYDSLCTDTRKRDYNSVIVKCTELLNSYPDSTESLDAIAKVVHSFSCY